MARGCDRQIAVAVLGSAVSEPFHDGGLRASGRGREIAVGEPAAASDRSSEIAVSGAVQIAALAAVVAAGVVASGGTVAIR